MDTVAARDLLKFIDDSPCPAFAADNIASRLGSAGYQKLSLSDAEWDLQPGGYWVRSGSSVIAFYLRSRQPGCFRILGAHTDSPHLRLKPKAAYSHEGCRQLAVEVYGKPLLNSWLDRDLALAGTVYSKAGREHRVRLHRPLARVAQLAIHLDSKVNEEGLKLNAQKHLAPIWGLGVNAGEEFMGLIAQAAGLKPAEILSSDLSLYDMTPAAFGGSGGELIFAPRLDNLASCHAGLLALLDAKTGADRGVPVLACFDHEEVGSESSSGAGSVLLSTVLERVGAALGHSRSGHLATLASSFMISADMAHGVHPNYADSHEPLHKPTLGGGPVLKTNHNQRYSSSAAGAAEIHGLGKMAGTALQNFVARTDLGCGTTIGPISASRLGIACADVGNPMLSMHSVRECAGTADHAPYIRLLTAHLRA